MNGKRIITTKLLSAILLLGVFLFTHALKAFHSHENISRCSITGLQFEKSNDCPVCDYQLAKDSDHPTAEFSSLNSPVQIAVYTSYKSSFISSIGLSYSDRGPPALL